MCGHAPALRLVRVRQVVKLKCVLERRTQVRVRLAQLVVAVHLVAVREVRAEIPRLGQVAVDVPRPAGGKLPGLGELLRAEFPQRVEHPVALAVEDDHGLVDEPDERGDHFWLLQ